MKAVLKRIVLFLGYIFQHNHRSKVVYYHDVSRRFTKMGTDFLVMKEHFSIINKCGYEIVPEITHPQGQVMICFDDGWEGIYSYVDDFVRLNIYPTIFIAVDLIGKEGYLTMEQIREMKEKGFRFQAHTWSHQDLTTFNEQELVHELKESKAWLERTFSQPFDSICFPMGRFSQLVKEKSLDFGYTKLFSSLPGGYYDEEHSNLICRNCAQDVSVNDFKLMLNGTSLIFKKKLLNQHFVKNGV